MKVENGNGVPGATSYLSLEEANGFIHSSEWEELADLQKERNLEEASKYLDLRYGEKYLGVRKTASQGLDFPRLSDYFRGKFLPEEIKLATAEVANLISSGIDIYESESKFGDIVSEAVSIGPISETIVYSGSKSKLPYFPKITMIISRVCSPSTIIERA